MQYAALLLALGFVAFAALTLIREFQRATGPAPTYRDRRHDGRDAGVPGCVTCALAAQGGSDTLARHLSQAHRA